jgi:methyltransferase-like protein
MERASAKGLQYLGETLQHTRLDDLSPEVQQTLQGLAEDLLQLEQYLDFLRNRTFRRTLLVHAEVALTREPTPERLMLARAASLTAPLSPTPDVRSLAVEQFRSQDGNKASTNNPLIKAVLVALHEVRPRTLAFEELREQVRSRLASDADAPSALELAEVLVRCYLANLVSLHVSVPRLAYEPGERPTVSPLARMQAATGNRVTNLRHRHVILDGLDPVVVRYLDGTRDRTALLDKLVELAVRDELGIERDGHPLRDPTALRTVLAEAIEPSLRRLADYGLLMA